MKEAWGLSYLLSAQWRLWLDWANAKADPSLRWVHSHFVGFVMSWLIYGLVTTFFLMLVLFCPAVWSLHEGKRELVAVLLSSNVITLRGEEGACRCAAAQQCDHFTRGAFRCAAVCLFLCPHVWVSLFLCFFFFFCFFVFFFSWCRMIFVIVSGDLFINFFHFL